MSSSSVAMVERRLSTATASSAASADFSDDEFGPMVPMKDHGFRNPPTVREGDFHCPTLEEVNRQIELLERKRLEFNASQLEHLTAENTSDWDRKKSILSLAARLKKMAITMAESFAFRTTPTKTTVSWLGTETDPQNYELCYQANGLTVWKKDFGNDRVIVRGEFLVPVSPKQYCEYASNVERRREWDLNVSEIRKVEQISDEVDIAYVAINRIATIYPRDYINIRVINELKSFGRPQRRHHKHQQRHHYNHMRSKQEHQASHGKRSGSLSSVRSGHKGDEEQCNGLNHKAVDGEQPTGMKGDDGKNEKKEERQLQNGDSKISELGDEHDAHKSGSLTSYGSSRIHISRHGCYASCSCSVEHPEIPEAPGKVRADVKVACYLAQPLYLPDRPINVHRRGSGTSEVGEAIKQAVAEAEPNVKLPELDPLYQHDEDKTTVWSRVYMFSEVDPKGWLPTTMSKHLAARVLPGTVERIVGCMLDHYHISWRSELVYDPDLDTLKKCDSALEYCYLKYLHSIGVDNVDDDDQGVEDN